MQNDRITEPESGPVLKSLADISRPTDKPEVVYAADDRIVLNGDYVIERSRCDTALKILQWVDHLSGKEWATKEMVCKFVTAAAKLNNINYHVGA